MASYDESGLLPYYKEGKKFVNPHIDDTKRRIRDFILWQLGKYGKQVEIEKAPVGFQYPNERKPIDRKKPIVQWINHCTFLLTIHGLHILTDPIWSTRCSPLRFIGPSRYHPPALHIDELPPIDIVLVSHNHYDHLDEIAVHRLHALNPTITWVVPLGLGRWFQKRGIHQIIELAWWQAARFTPRFKKQSEVSIRAVPSQHFSGRGVFDTDKTLWAGYVVDFEKGDEAKRLYFVGDTGYNPYDFKNIGAECGPMDLSLIPIGTYVPHEFMDPVHIDPYKAVEIHKDAHSKFSVGMHWKTFCLSGEGMEQPPYDLFRALQKSGLDPTVFRALDIGQEINW